jgi:hypothetical protein
VNCIFDAAERDSQKRRCLPLCEFRVKFGRRFCFLNAIDRQALMSPRFAIAHLLPVRVACAGLDVGPQWHQAVTVPVARQNPRPAAHEIERFTGLEVQDSLERIGAPRRAVSTKGANAFDFQDVLGAKTRIYCKGGAQGFVGVNPQSDGLASLGATKKASGPPI